MNKCEKEGILSCKMRCDNIAKCYGYSFDYDNKKFYMLEEYAENSITLQERLSYKCDEKTKGKFIKQIANALNYLFSICVCHYDLKTDNIMVTKDDNIKIIDFGESIKWDGIL